MARQLLTYFDIQGPGGDMLCSLVYCTIHVLIFLPVCLRCIIFLQIGYVNHNDIYRA